MNRDAGPAASAATMSIAVPRLDDPRLRLLRELLLMNPEVRMPAAVPRPDLGDLHGQVLQVAVGVLPGFEEGYCWYNAREAAHRMGGAPIAGWAIWRRGPELTAQPHSIWQRDDGELLDVTPNAAAEPSILFMPDKRTPFDYVDLRRPAAFLLPDDMPVGIWEVAAGDFETFYVVGRPDPASWPEIETYCARLREGRGGPFPGRPGERGSP